MQKNQRKIQDKMGDEDLITRKRIWTLFLLFFPSVLVAVVPSQVGGSIWWSLVFKGLLLFYQFVVIKNFIDVHYER